MYLDLIDVVSTIVRKYGVSILSEPRFWNILSDSYSFALNYSLRDAFKNCINIGYVSQLVSLKGNPKETRKLIQHIADTENHINANNEKELVAACCWTFKNGVVQLFYRYVVYVPSSFFTLAEEIANKKKIENGGRRTTFKISSISTRLYC